MGYFRAAKDTLLNESINVEFGFFKEMLQSETSIKEIVYVDCTVLLKDCVI